MNLRPINVRPNKSALREESGRSVRLRLILALLVILALSVMPVSMADRTTAAHATTATPMAMDDCTGHHETAPDKHQSGTQDCAMACAVVEPVAPQLAVETNPVRSVLSPQPSPRLNGIAPEATSPPPRLFPEI